VILNVNLKFEVVASEGAHAVYITIPYIVVSKCVRYSWCFEFNKGGFYVVFIMCN
jgi:hypothetical protein